MTILNRTSPYALSLQSCAAGIILVFSSSSQASDDNFDPEVLRLIKPESSISLGLGVVSGDSQRYGMYSGLHESGPFAIGEFSFVRRDDSTGTWLRAQGRNLGIPQAELRVEHEHQGRWLYFAEFDQSTRYSPYTFFSNLQGIGTPSVRYPDTNTAQAKSTVKLPDMSQERQNARFGVSYYFNPSIEFKVLFQNTEKKGERPFGRGTPSVQEFLVEPIDWVTRQLDVVLNYTGTSLQISGGYYGSLFQNANSQLNVIGGDSALRSAASPNLPFSQISLAPDNIAHQLHLTGAYQFTDQTRGTFKLSHAIASQRDGFMGIPAPTSGGLPPGGLNLSGRTELGGRVGTTLANLGLTARPLKDLSLLANVRYENRHDSTAVARYINVTSTTSSTDGYNEPRSLATLNGKLEASYRLPAGYRLTGGVDYEEKERSISGVRVVGYRNRTQEISERIELKKSLAEDLNGSIAYIHSDRGGSAYGVLQTWNATTGAFNTGTSYSNAMQPIYIADRVRNKIRLFADWTPLDALNLQVAAESAEDNYGAGRNSLDIGVRRGNAQLLSLDATWTISDNWRVNGWVSHSVTRMHQADGNSAATLWTASLINQTDSLGIGVRGKLTGRIDIGADAMIARDKSEYKQDLAAMSSQMPDICYDQTTLKLFGRYALDKDTNIRLDMVFDHRKTNDWTWSGADSSGGYVYTDGSWVYQDPNQRIHFVGLTYNFMFR